MMGLYKEQFLEKDRHMDEDLYLDDEDEEGLDDIDLDDDADLESDWDEEDDLLTIEDCCPRCHSNPLIGNQFFCDECEKAIDTGRINDEI